MASKELPVEVRHGMTGGLIAACMGWRSAEAVALRQASATVTDGRVHLLYSDGELQTARAIVESKPAEST